jgi:threonine/homoserine/homoserine lactone efflux protein
VTQTVVFLKAMIAGFVLAVPIGATGAICLRRALQGRWAVGLVTGFGAAVADALFAAAAIYGLSLFTRYIADYRELLTLLGGIFLILVGMRMIRKRTPKLDAAAGHPEVQLRNLHAWTAAFVTGFVLTVMNPATLLGFAAVFAGLGLLHSAVHGLAKTWPVVLGALLGSMMWWLTLTGAASAVRHHLSLEFIVVMNVVLGLLVAGFGVVALLSLASAAFT